MDYDGVIVYKSVEKCRQASISVGISVGIHFVSNFRESLFRKAKLFLQENALSFTTVAKAAQSPEKFGCCDSKTNPVFTRCE
jgi:hypothetical protein